MTDKAKVEMWYCAESRKTDLAKEKKKRFNVQNQMTDKAKEPNLVFYRFTRPTKGRNVILIRIKWPTDKTPQSVASYRFT